MHPARLLLLSSLLSISLAQAATVRQFAPQGRIDQQTRATAVFSADMVALGDAKAPAPFKVQCGKVSGEGRWVDARTWAWQLARPLQAGETCEFILESGLKAVSGEAVGGQNRYSFFAAGPWPRSILPRPENRIAEDQAFVIDAGGPIKRASVEAHMWCEADGVGNRIAVRNVPDAQRKEILKHVGHNEYGPNSLVVSCAERLPAGAKVKLVWDRGIEAENGAKSEKQESFVYKVAEPFRATMSCERERANAPCSPLSTIRVEFSAPTDAKLVRKAVLTTPEGKRVPIGPDKNSSSEETTSDILFSGPFPQNAELTLELPGGIKDDAGRPLANAASFPLKLRTGALPPLAKFPGNFGIIELKEGGLLPVTLRNVEAKLPSRDLRLPGGHRFSEQRLTEDGDVIAAMRALQKFEAQGRDVEHVVDGQKMKYYDSYYARELPFLAKRPGVTSQELPKPGGSSEFEVVGIPLAKPGYHIVEIESRMLGAALLATPKPMYVRAAALVTNMAVHLKRGRDNALVWVTTLDTGKPVPDAEVRVSNCDGTALWQGRTDSQGRAMIDKALPGADCKGDNFIFASARLGEDYSFVRSDWNEGLESWRFGVETWGEQTAFKIHTVLDRSLFRPGQTVAMKHVARSRDSKGFHFPDKAELPTKLTIRHYDGTEFSQPLAWNEQGVALSQWKIPDAAKRGPYEITLSGGKHGMVSTGEFKVADFRLPVFTGSIQGVPTRQVAPSKVPMALGLSFLNGGAAKGVPVEVSATLRPRWPEYAHFERFNFYVEFDPDAMAAFGVAANREHENVVLDHQPVTLDKAGAGKLEIPLPAKPKGPSEVYAEMSFTDPNGEVQTIHGSVELWPSNVVLGVNVGEWAESRGPGNRIELVALDTAGRPLANQPITVKAKRRIDYSHRRRIVGGFYAYENSHEFKDLGEVCNGRTDSRGIFYCQVQGDEPGSIYVLAESRDGDGNVAQAGGSFWVGGSGDLWFAAGNQDRIDVIPEKNSYKPGETARLQVRTPFAEATALISVEAGGIIETYVQPLSRFKPVIELPVKEEWGPNAYVSVLAVRGRVQPLKWYSFFQWGWREPVSWFKEWWNPEQPTAMVDLAKPAYRLGLAEIGVGTEGFRLKVDITPDKADYRPREEATVRLHVTRPDGSPAPAGSEVAFAAVDQALLELRPNESWKLLEAMLQKRAYEVETATAQGQVIGKRHFGKKALPPGGGGGRGPARELFDTLLTWNPQVKLDANGNATLKVAMNDSLTEFKLVGVATAGTGLFGTGSAAVRTKQDLQMISGLPPLVREKDAFQGLLTLRNGTARAMTVNVSASAGGKALEARQVKLEPEGAAEVAWTTQAPEDVSSLTWEFEAKEQGTGSASDRLKIVQQIAPATPVTVQQATFTRVEGKYEVPVVLPNGALPGKGGLEISLSPKLSSPPPGLKRFFETYPFSCLEQKTSIAVGLHDAKRWDEIANNLPAYLDEHGLARYFPGEGPGSPVLTAYVLDMASLAAFKLPEDARTRMVQGLAAFAEGRIKPKYWSPQDDLPARKIMALEALTRQGEKPVRVAAALDVEPLRLATSTLIDWYLTVKRLPDLPDREAKLKAAEQELRNRLAYTGGRLGFTTEKSDYWWWMMVSGDSNAFRLIEAMLDEPAWREDLPKLVRGAMERQVRGHWFTTTANAWATVTLDKFGQTFEKEAVAGTTRASLGKNTASLDWKSVGAGTPPAPLALPWPAPGNEERLNVSHAGTGKPWAAIQTLAAIPAGNPRAFGYKVTRTVTPLQEKEKGKVSRGDLWRVSINVEADQDMTWVVVSDPIPAGAKILGDGDGRDSRIATMDEDKVGRRLWPTFVERTFGFFRAYYEVVPRGGFKIDYTVRINNAGEFSLPPTRVEAMYAPDVFGEVPNGKVTVRNTP